MQKLSENRINADNNNPAITVNNVGVAYRRRKGILQHEKYWALKNISFELFHGETLGIIGRNGVGKSSLLRLIAGIISPDRGEIVNHGVTTSLLSLQVGFAKHLTGRENAILSGLMLGLSKEEILGKIQDIARYADIGESFEQPVNYYSHGMRARLGFSVAVFADPDVILLDEVLGVGDIDFKEKSTQSMKEKIKSNKTVVLVSHTAGLLRDTCDRIIWIENGEVREEGDVENIISNYQKYEHERKKIKLCN